jgi:hypothetical protein
MSLNPVQARFTLCDKVCQWLATGRWFSPDTLISSTNKTDHHDIAEILLKVALNTITPNPCMGNCLLFKLVYYCFCLICTHFLTTLIYFPKRCKNGEREGGIYVFASKTTF